MASTTQPPTDLDEAPDTVVTGGPIPDSLRRELEDLGLNANQARLLLALLRLGPSKIPQLAPVSGVPRTSVYQVLEELHGKGLAERVSVSGPAVWASPGRDAILDRLNAAEQERLLENEIRMERVRELLAETFPDTPAVRLSHARVIRGAPQVRRAYERMLAETRTELVMFTRPPYSWAVGRANPAVLATLERGVRARVLYQAAEWAEPAAAAFRDEVETYHAAGVQARLVEELPIKLVVSDRRTALVAMTEPTGPDDYPTTVWIEHYGYAALHADAFERRWATGRPLMRLREAEPTDQVTAKRAELQRQRRQ